MNKIFCKFGKNEKLLQILSKPSSFISSLVIVKSFKSFNNFDIFFNSDKSELFAKIKFNFFNLIKSLFLHILFNTFN